MQSNVSILRQLMKQNLNLQSLSIDWNENRAKACLKILNIKPLENSICKRPTHKNILSKKTY